MGQSDERRDEQRPLDLICIGRAAVDLYGEQVGTRLEDVASFAKYLGGCAANIAAGTARLGLRSAMIARVGDEQMGSFVREQLAAEGVDVSQVVTDPDRLTALVILGIRDRKDMPHVFYRTDCADMALTVDDIKPAFIASARALLVTGTHFSTAGVDQASRAAIRYARRSGAKVILDIDYRPVLWGLAGHRAGEKRFVVSDNVTRHLQTILADCDLVVGTEEEIAIAGGSTDCIEAVRAIRAVSAATIVVKRGPMGCVIFADEIPARIEDGVQGPGFPVEVFNTLGAGDGFLSGFLRGWLTDQPLSTCARFGNAAGALVVSRHGCSPASPSWPELQYFLDHGSAHFRLREDPVLNQIHRTTTRRVAWPEIMALAFDHRSQFRDMADAAGADDARIATFKLLIATALQRTIEAAGIEGRAGLLVDDVYGLDVLEQMTGRGVWIGRPVELPGSRPVKFEAGPNISGILRSWPAEHVVKCLVFYHPDDPDELKLAQRRRIGRLYRAAVETGHELLLELLPPSTMPADGVADARAMAEFYQDGIFPDWWKLAPADKAGWDAIEAVIEQHDRHCRGVLLLGRDVAIETLREGVRVAASRRWCKGFAVGRSIFGDAALAWFAGEMSDDQALKAMTARYRTLVEMWRKAR